MPVKIEILGSADAPDYARAQVLKERWDSDLRGAEGRVALIPNALLFGHRTREHDLIAIGHLSRPKLVSRVKCRFLHEAESAELREASVQVYNFAFHIEIKSHDQRGVRFHGAAAEVRYRDGWVDVSAKSHKQKSALINFLREHAGVTPFVCNFIWFTEFEQKIFPRVPHNFLAKAPSFDWTIRLACLQNFPHPDKHDDRKGRLYAFRGALNAATSIERALGLFEREPPAVGALTRKKLEAVAAQETRVSDVSTTEDLGKRMLYVEGRAGTGKTMRLIHWAHRLAEKDDKRILLLTYNLALVSDIRRLLALAKLDVSSLGEDVEVRTFHSWLYEVVVAFGLYEQSKGDFLDQLDDLKAEMLEYVRIQVTEKGIEALRAEFPLQLAWDFVFVDESQDWPDDERDIVRELTSPRELVVADGVDQMVRWGVSRTSWRAGVDHKRERLRTTLRQEGNLVNFVHQLARRMGYRWDVRPHSKLTGGRVVVVVGEYTRDLHDREYKLCRDAGNFAYEYLFLCPPSMVERSGTRRFKLLDRFRAMGIELWDGTSADLRKEFPTNADEFRVVQYDSCRGLEGWTVVCLNFDELIDYKNNQFREMKEDQGSLLEGLQLRSQEERTREFVAQWATIPLTRAVDTLVLQLKSGDSRVAHDLWALAGEMDGVIEWVGPKPGQ